jgi:hypothetical protein
VTKKILVVVEPLRMKLLAALIESNGTIGDLKDYVILPQGKCEVCLECDPGQYNPECNKWEVGVEPKGQ